MARKPLLFVELPVCDECERVGKIPADTFLTRGQMYCIGPTSAGHTKKRMRKVKFREVRK